MNDNEPPILKNSISKKKITTKIKSRKNVKSDNFFNLDDNSDYMKKSFENGDLSEKSAISENENEVKIISLKNSFIINIPNKKSAQQIQNFKNNQKKFKSLSFSKVSKIDKNVK